jgi:Derlin-2/3
MLNCCIAVIIVLLSLHMAISASVNSLPSFGKTTRLHSHARPVPTTSWLRLRCGEKAETPAEATDVGIEEPFPEEYEAEQTAGHVIPAVDTLKEIWRKTPPVTQAYVGSSIAITIFSFVFNGNRWPNILHFDWGKIATGEIWRVVTAFLYFGQLDIFFPLTMQFVWQHMTQLEKLNYKNPEDFVVMVMFGGSTLIALYTVLGISTKFLGHNLATYLVYIWSRVFEGTDVNFMDLFTLKSELLPWFFCAQTMLLEQDVPWADLIGIFVGHLYHYLKQKDSLKAPEFLVKWFQSPSIRARYAPFKSEFE